MFDILYLIAMNIGVGGGSGGNGGGSMEGEYRRTDAAASYKDDANPAAAAAAATGAASGEENASASAATAAPAGCAAVAACIYFLVTSSFAWMLMEGLSQYQSLYVVFSTKEINKRFCALIGRRRIGIGIVDGEGKSGWGACVGW